MPSFSQRTRALAEAAQADKGDTQLAADVGDVVGVALGLVDIHDPLQLLQRLGELAAHAVRDPQLLARLRQHGHRPVMLQEQGTGPAQHLFRLVVCPLEAQAHPLGHQRFGQGDPVALCFETLDGASEDGKRLV